MPDLKKLQNEIKIGLTIVIAMLIAVVGFRLMQDIPLFRPSLQLYTVFDRVDGVTPGSTVYMSGVKIGSVNRVRLEGPDSVVVVMNISYTDGIPVESKAVIESSDLIGGKHIAIYPSGKNEMIPDGGYLEGVYDRGPIEGLEEFAGEMKPDIRRGTGSLAELLGEIEELLKEGGREHVEQTLGSLSRSSGQINRLLQERGDDLEKSIISLQNIMANLDTLSSGRESQLDSLLMNLETTSRELGVVSHELGGVSTELHLMMQHINKGEGTLGKLIQDPSLYENLDSLAVNLNNLSRLIQDNPGHFLKHMRLIDIF